MPKNDLLAALDIGTTKIACILADLTEDQDVVVIGVGVTPSHGLRRGVVVDIDGTAVAVEQAVERACAQAGRDCPPVYVGVTGEHISSLNSKGVTAITHMDKEITEEDRQRVLQQSQVIVLPPDRGVVHAIPRSYSIDGQPGIRHPVGMYGNRLEVETHIVTGAHTFLMNIEKCVARAGLGLKDQVLAPLATGEAVVTRAEKDMGICMVDIGGGTTDLAVYQEGEIYYSAVIPVGGHHVTNDLAQLLRVTSDEAERIKVNHASASSEGIGDTDSVPVTQIGRTEPRQLRTKAVSEIVEARMQELLQLVRKEIGKSGCSDRLNGGVVLTGGGSQLKGTVQVAGELLRMPVRLGHPESAAGLGDAVTSPIFSTAMGLIRYGLRELEQDYRSGGTGDFLSGAFRAVSRYWARFRKR